MTTAATLKASSDKFQRELYLSVIKVDPSTGFCEFPIPGEFKKQILIPLIDADALQNGSAFQGAAESAGSSDPNAAGPGGKEYWMPDRLCKVCYSCEDAFTMYRRRHHCRMCGQVFCNPCSSYYIDGGWINLTGPQRACKFCSEQLSERIEREAKQRRRGSLASISVSGSPSGMGASLLEHRDASLLHLHQPQQAVLAQSGHVSSIKESPQTKLQHTNALQELASRHLESVVEKMLLAIAVDGSPVKDLWKNIVINLTREVVSTVDPDVRQGDAMDIRKYVKIKIIPGGSMDENAYVDGIVLRKNVSDKHMASRGAITKPRVLLLAGGIEFQRYESKFSSLETLIEQENKYIEILVDKILSLCPDVVVVGKSISRRAQELLCAQRVVALQNVKPQQLDRMSRMLSAKIFPSTDHMIQADGDDCLGFCENFSIRQVQDDPEREEKVPKSGGILKTRVCRGSSYIYLEGCPSVLGCSIILRGAPRALLREIKRLLKFSIAMAYHLRLEVAYLCDRFVRIPTNVDMTSSYAYDSDTEEWEVDDRGGVAAPQLPTTLPTRPLLRAAFSDRAKRLGLSTSLEVDIYLPYINPIRGIVLKEERDEPKPDAQANMFTAISGTSVVAGDKAQKFRAEKQLYQCYSESDVTLGQFLMDRCFRLHKYKDRETYAGHCWNFAHRSGRVEIEVILEHSSSGGVLPDDDDTASNPYTYPIFTSSFCNLCNNWVTPLEPIADETWKLSMGKFLEIILYNKSAICGTGECSHAVRDNHYQSFFCDTSEGRFQARVCYHPLHPYSIHVRKQLPFDDKFHNEETVKFLTQFLHESDVLLNDFTRILHVLAKEVADNLRGAEDAQSVATADVSSILLEVSDEKAAIQSSIDSALIYLKDPTARSASAKIDSSNELRDDFDFVDGIPENVPFPDKQVMKIELRFPALFYKNLLMKALEWNKMIDYWHRFLSSHAKQSTGGHLSGKYTSIEHAETASTVGLDGAAVGLDEEVTDSSPEEDNSPEDLLQMNATRTISGVVDVGSNDSTVFTRGRSGTSVSQHGGHSTGMGAPVAASLPLRTERRASTATQKSRFARALSNFGFTLREDHTPDSKFSVPLDDLTNQFRFTLDPGPDGEVVAVNEEIIASIISYSLSSKDYWTKFSNEIGDNDDYYDIMPRDEIMFDAEKIPEMAVPTKAAAQRLRTVSADDESIIDSQHLQQQQQQQNQSNVLPTILGTAKVVTKPDEPVKFCSIEEEDEGDINLHINQLLSTTKLHIKHRFEDKDDEDSVTCKFIVHIFWAIQFHALRSCFLNDETDEGFVRSLAQTASWNAQGGKSGAAFSKTLDGRFVVKCISRTELQMFVDFCPEYFKYIADSYSYKRPTALCKILGIYSVGFHNKVTGKKVMEQVVVMENVFYDRNITRIFDLKGSSRARYTQTDDTESFDSLLMKRREARRNKAVCSRRPANGQVLMDDNLMELTKGLPFPLKHLANIYLQTAIENDTDFLQNVNIVDYSIIVGIDEDNFEIVVGIIDYMRQYDMIKRVERIGKSVGMIAGQAEPTIVQPSQYKKRFRLAMERNFMSVPDKFDV